MRDALAERLLAKVMKWTQEDVARERPDLQALATFKYDDYQQFSPGMRFIESFALWLAQFESDDERKQAYEFIRSRLVFISTAEMMHFVSMTFPDHIRPFLIRQSAFRSGMSERFVRKIANSIEFKTLQRQSLFLALSDGAHIDYFRRSNPQIIHEQVFQDYRISKTTADDTLSKLANDLEKLRGRKPTDPEKKFRMMFLLDDFSGSGISYLRKESETSQYDGKIHKVFSSIINKDEGLNSLVDPNDLQICIILYVATEHAQLHLQKSINEWLEENQCKYQCEVFIIHTLPDEIKLHPDNDSLFIDLLKKYFDESIIDDHYRKGRYEDPYLGFDQCALPLILSHNTPNNSVPLLWYESHRKYKGLFPRVSRRREL